MARIVGLDFGTTNSALAVIDDNAAVRLAGFPTAAGDRPTFRSILFFDADEHGPNTLARPPPAPKRSAATSTAAATAGCCCR